MKLVVPDVSARIDLVVSWFHLTRSAVTSIDCPKQSQQSIIIAMVIMVSVCALSPASLAHLRMDVTSLPFCVLQTPLRAAALTPIVFRLVFTPHRYAVAVAALSAIWKSTL